MKNVFNYQTVLVFGPKVSEKNTERVLAKLESMVEGSGAKIKAKEHTGVKDLAYQIGGFSRGDFWIVEMESVKPLKLTEINIFLNRDTDIIRYLVLKK